MRLTLGHSPDPDDILITYPILAGIVRLKREIHFQEVCLDIELLNKLVLEERLDISAISAATFLRVYKSYYLIRYGASTGYRYGPKLIYKELRGPILVGVPGMNTTARLVAELYLRSRNVEYRLVEIPHDKVLDLLRIGVIDGGVVIHEEQLTCSELEREGFRVVDLGEWWFSETNLPLPLGVNVVHKRVGEDLAQEISQLYAAAIYYSLTNIDSMLDLAIKYSRITDREIIKKFLLMYVRPDPISTDELRAMQRLCELAYENRLIELSETEFEIIVV